MKLPFVIGNRPIQGNFDALAKEVDVPRFRVYRNAALSLASNGVVTFDTEEEDTHNWHSAGVYTPQRAGTYRFSWGVRPNAVLTADVFWVAFLRKNGAVAKIGQIGFQRGTVVVNSVGSAQLDANGTTDAFDILIQHSVGAAQALSVGSGLNTFFDGELVGS